MVHYQKNLSSQKKKGTVTEEKTYGKQIAKWQKSFHINNYIKYK